MHSYWQKQSSTKPLFPDIEWNKPEQKTRAGKLAIIGGSKLSFVAVATAYQEATQAGAGQVRVILPDALKSVIPATILDTVYAHSTQAGSIGKAGTSMVQSAVEWADHTLCIGDAGRNSETAIVYETLLSTPGPMTITRDAVDLLKQVTPQLLNREKTTIVVSFAQLQKLFQGVYYPKMLGFSMQVNLLVEILHKFTITYPVTIVTFHQNQLIIAYGGDVVSQEFDNPMLIWRGTVATRIACYQLWTPNKPLEAVTAGIYTLV